MLTGIFVGHRDVLDGMLKAIERGAVLDVVGIPGSGRTSLLRALGRELARGPRTVVIPVDGSLYSDEASPSGAGAPSSSDAARLLEDLREQVDAPDVLRRTPDEGTHQPTVASVADHLRAGSTERTLVLLVDDAAALATDARKELSRVLQRLVERSSVAAVLVRTPAGLAPPQSLRAEPFVVLPLRREDVATYLHEGLSRAVDDDIIDAVHAWSGGYPPAVLAAADRIEAAGHTDFARLVRHGVSVPMASMVLRDVPADLRPIVDVAGVLRAATVTDLLDVLDHVGTAPRVDIATALASLPLLQQDDERTYRFPPFLREHIARELRNQRSDDADTDRFDKINNEAVRLYRGKLKDKLNDGSGSVYASWERLEHSETEHLLLAFAYHGGLRKGSEHARFPLAHVFFDVVWWWAWYVDSPFLRQLLAAWRSSARGDEDRDFVTDLDRFRTAYVAMADSQGDRAAAGAADAVAALQEITRTLDLAPTGASNRHVLAITNALMGDALRALDVRDPRVDACYQRALDEFRENGAQAAVPTPPGQTRTLEDDAWCVPWMLFRQADVALERGSTSTAQARAHEALGLALAPADQGDLDYEVIANCHRVLGDALLVRNPAGAFREFVRVVFACYVFHVTPLPDEYTRRFHREQVEAVMNRLKRLARAQPRVAPAIMEELASWNLGSGSGDWSDLLARQCWDEVQTLVFPREPWREEFDRSTAYSQRVGVVREALAATLLEATPESGRAKSKMRRLVDWRAQSAARRSERTARYAGLADPAVEVDYFTPADDDYWPRWWLDENAPGTWPDDLDRDESLPDDIAAALRNAIAELPPLRRQVLEFRDVHQWSRTAVSRELGISEDDQMLMLHRARSAVRRALDQRLFGTRDP